MRALYKVLEKDFNIDRIDGAFIRTDEKRFTKFKKQEIEKVVEEIRSVKKK